MPGDVCPGMRTVNEEVLLVQTRVLEAAEHYAALGAKQDASKFELCQRYLQAGKMVHPTISTHPQATAAFQRAAAAWIVLGDDAQRRSYDLALSSGHVETFSMPTKEEACLTFTLALAFEMENGGEAARNSFVENFAQRCCSESSSTNRSESEETQPGDSVGSSILSAVIHCVEQVSGAFMGPDMGPCNVEIDGMPCRQCCLSRHHGKVSEKILSSNIGMSHTSGISTKPVVPGTRVELMGLKSAACLNGRRGVVLEWETPPERYQIRLICEDNKTETADVKLVKRENFNIIAPPGADMFL